MGRAQTPESQRILREIGGRVTRFREGRGLSQTELASLAGMHRRVVYAVEHGERESQIFTIMKIAHALGRSCDEILLGVEE